METYIQQAKSEEKKVLQRYVDKCKFFYGITLCCVTIAVVAVNFGPFLLPQPFPFEVHYPFCTDDQPLKTIIYLHHIMLAYQSYVQVCANVFVALLLWFIAARFEILSGEFRKATNFSEFIRCIQLHQQLLKRYSVQRQPFTIKGQFLALGVSALIEVFVCAWPADHVLNMVRHATIIAGRIEKERDCLT
ncbi:PREDICTED: uncharacterized protein LOC106747253 [Dinoponera quadriceps]|uniref:Uncharacterized protein LOC106747253 n=1 Tax=Dinoponera quadriceps TaxID=609295 RepID=A0A6P3XQ00_DINQU|nr:PREDICTED: uncharacterized protein LOC106747253 [Dinoponera quadriceps]